MAEAILLDHVKKTNQTDRIFVKSAGLYTTDGIKTSAGTRYALMQHQIDFDGESSQITEDLLDWADLILTMTDSHQEALRSFNPEQGDKIHTLNGYVYPSLTDKKRQIQDPFGQDEAVYLATFDEINQGIAELIKQNNL